MDIVVTGLTTGLGVIAGLVAGFKYACAKGEDTIFTRHPKKTIAAFAFAGAAAVAGVGVGIDLYKNEHVAETRQCTKTPAAHQAPSLLKCEWFV